MQSLSKYNKGIKYLLCAIDLFSKYVRVVPIKDKKGTSIVNAFKKIISEKRKSNKIWVDQDSEFYNKSFKDFLKINNIEMYSTYNEEKSVVAERFIKTLKNKVFKHMTAISKYIYSDVLDDIVYKYNNTVHRTIKMKSNDVTGNFYVESNKNGFNKDSLKLHSIKLISNLLIYSTELIMLEFQNIKAFLLKDVLQIGQMKFLLLIKLKIQFLGLVLLLI